MPDTQNEMGDRLLNGCLAAWVIFGLLVGWTGAYEGGWEFLASVSGFLVTIGLGEWVYVLFPTSLRTATKE